jgi:hypothetical protein
VYVTSVSYVLFCLTCLKGRSMREMLVIDRSGVGNSPGNRGEIGWGSNDHETRVCVRESALDGSRVHGCPV